MRTLFVSLASALLLAGPAGAATRQVPDLDYLNARRCQGLAEGLRADVDAARLAAFTEAQGRLRIAAITDMGWEEYRRAKRQALDGDQAAQRQAELAGRCAAFGGAELTAGR